MAFNFNWSPLTADASFYARAQELLTTALNKSPKPPIIVDDILVNELNLGHVPPELEVLEIGDLAEDRFRGIFKTSYHGDAFLTLKTRVQANPLNTHLLTRPSFASPQPLAASTGLTIPLQITLSDIRLSGFVILVFSRQKGLTLVFRNDPLESLKVSSTFDSIPFVRDYLQKEIEGQLRLLLMDELPAIIHRLSQRLWVPEYRAKEEPEAAGRERASPEDPVVDPFASPPQDPVDAHGNKLNPSEIASLSIETGVETQSLFSQRNLLRLASLADSHRTLSLSTASIQDVAFRAWAGPTERGEMGGLRSPAIRPALSRSHSHADSTSTSYTVDRTVSLGRPSLQSFASQGYGLNLGPGRHPKGHGGRQRKKRVVNLRKKPEAEKGRPVGEDRSASTDTESVTESTGSAPSVFSAPSALALGLGAEDRERLPPQHSPDATIKASQRVDWAGTSAMEGSTSAQAQRRLARIFDPPSSSGTALDNSWDSDGCHMDREPHTHSPADVDATPRASTILAGKTNAGLAASQAHASNQEKHARAGPSDKPPDPAWPDFLRFITDPANGGSIAEQAWMMKMAGEIARRYQEGREKDTLRSDPDAPPAYEG